MQGVTLSPEVAINVVRAAYKLKQIDEAVLAQVRQMDNADPQRTVIHQLVSNGQLSESVACQIMAKLYQMKAVHFSEDDLDPAVTRKLKKEFIIRHQVVPLKIESGCLRVLVADPSKATLQAMLADLTKLDVVVSLTTLSGIHTAINSNIIVNQIDEAPKKKKEPKKESAEPSSFSSKQFNLRRKYRMDDPEAVIDIVRDILADVIDNNASDIHIEPYRNTARMRWRIDGVMREQNQYQPYLENYYAAIMSRLKLMAGCDISERRLPQDGAITFLHKGEEVDFRFNIMPTKYGERPVLRKLQGTPDLTLDKLGFDPDDFDKIVKSIHAPQGMVLVTGPTGSGKSTTLFAALQMINRPETNILTAEDPVEYYLEGVGQVQANEQIGLDFPSILRGFLRQDPEIILVGEIRDKETVDIAIKAALTGHLLLSTLHTNDAIGTVVRLLNMGVPSFMISSALSLIVAQRLARKNCGNCLIDDPAGTPENLMKVGFSEDEISDVQAKRGKGCEQCGGEGYKGRQGLYEVLAKNPALEDAILREALAPELLAAAKTTGFKTMQEIARGFIKQGVISLEEYQRVLVIE